MATGATTGSRGGGSMQPGGHPAASPAHAAGAVHPARVSTEEPALPLAAVHRAQEGALLASEAQATTSVLRQTATVQNALLALTTITASVMIVARAVRGAKASPVAARLAPDAGMRRFVALAAPIITWPPGSPVGRHPARLYGPEAMVSPRPSLAMDLSRRLGRRQGSFTDRDMSTGLSLASIRNRTTARWLCRTAHAASDCVVPGAAELAANRSAR
jgi:hypothetical protein